MSPTLSPAVDSHCPAYPATPWPHGLPQSAHLDPGPGNHVYYAGHGCPPCLGPNSAGMPEPCILSLAG